MLPAMIFSRDWLCVLAMSALLGSSAFAQEEELQRLLQENRYEEAVPLLVQRVKADPGDNLSRFRLGQILNFQGQPERAIAIWRDGLDQGVADPSFWLAIGNRYRQLAEDGPTVLRVGGAVTYDPNKQLEINERDWRQERWNKAIEAFHELVQAMPEDVGAALRLADTFQASGNLEKAEEWWKHVLYLDPTHKLATERVNGMERLKQDVKEAAQAIANGEEPAPRDSPLFNLAATEAIEIMTQRLQGNPADDKTRARLGQMLAYQGQSERALNVWQQGLDGQGDDAALWLQIGDFYRESAEKSEALLQASMAAEEAKEQGQVPGQSAVKKTEEELAEEELKTIEVWNRAVQAYQNVVAEDANNIDAVMRYAHALQGTRENDAAEQWWQHVFELDPTNTLAAVRCANLQLERKDVVAAGGTLMAGLDADPRNAALWLFGANLANYMGDEQKAIEATEKAKFYGWLPPFCKDVEYSEEMAAVVTALRDPKQMEGAVEDLIGTPGPASSQLLAAVCWHRKIHGQIETACFEELTRRQDGDLLVELFTTGNSSFTIQYAGHALAELKHSKAFELLVEVLPQDIKPVWHMDIANSLAVLGDPRAVPPLIQVLDPERLDSRTYLSTEDPSIATDGPLFARHRAALALGKFDDPQAKEALTQGLKNMDIAVACNAALYRQTDQLMHLRAIEPIQGETRDLLMGYIAEIDRPAAQDLHKRWTEFREAEKREALKVQEDALKARSKQSGPQPSGALQP